MRRIIFLFLILTLLIPVFIGLRQKGIELGIIQRIKIEEIKND